MKIHIVGNGIAAFMLADKLKREDMDVCVFGRGPSQAPPQVLVHLFAGRSFRRSNLEVETFRDSVDYWRSSPYSIETTVNRESNSRLEKSLTHTENLPWGSPILTDGQFRYGPAFVIDSKSLLASFQNDIKYREVRVMPGNEELKACDQIVWATGFKNNLPFCVLNEGASIAINDIQPSKIRIGSGVHYSSNGKTSAIGGAFLDGQLDQPKSLLLERAKTLIPSAQKIRFESADIFLGKKSISRDRLPVIGTDPNGRFLFTAFGSRAFFWLPSSTKLAVDLLRGNKTESPFSPLRFSEQKS